MMIFDPTSSNEAALDEILHGGDKGGHTQAHNVFPHAIYTKHLEPDPKIFDAMFEFMQRFDEHSAQNIRSRTGEAGDPSESHEGDVGAAREESDGKPRRPFASTGDVQGYGKLSSCPEFRMTSS